MVDAGEVHHLKAKLFLPEVVRPGAKVMLSRMRPRGTASFPKMILWNDALLGHKLLRGMPILSRVLA
jgi:hypothetical protein